MGHDAQGTHQTETFTKAISHCAEKEAEGRKEGKEEPLIGTLGRKKGFARNRLSKMRSSKEGGRGS